MKFTLLLAAIAMVLASVSAFMAPSAFAGSRVVSISETARLVMNRAC
jgi:hypothetical protein